MSDHDHQPEPVLGLPEQLPPGERIIWQGAPGTAALARAVFRIRGLAVYFALLMAWPAASVLLGQAAAADALSLAAWLGVLAGVCLGTLFVLARLMARTAMYTMTNKRVVLRIGVALSLSINLPFRAIESAALGLRRDGSGDIALRVTGTRVGYLTLWPHVRPWHFRNPQPMLRAIPDAQRASALLTEALLAEAGQPAGDEPAAADTPAGEFDSKPPLVAVGQA